MITPALHSVYRTRPAKSEVPRISDVKTEWRALCRHEVPVRAGSASHPVPARTRGIGEEMTRTWLHHEYVTITVSMTHLRLGAFDESGTGRGSLSCRTRCSGSATLCVAGTDLNDAVRPTAAEMGCQTTCARGGADRRTRSEIGRHRRSRRSRSTRLLWVRLASAIVGAVQPQARRSLRSSPPMANPDVARSEQRRMERTTENRPHRASQ